MGGHSTGDTGTGDVTYNLVSVVYHALQGAETDEKYIRDAEAAGNPQVVQYFRDVKERNCETAERGKELLRSML
jgi:hypothetical protein